MSALLGGSCGFLFVVLSRGKALRRRPQAAVGARPHAHVVRVDRRRDGEVHLVVQLRERVPFDGGGLRNVTERRRVDHVADDVPLDSLVLQRERQEGW